MFLGGNHVSILRSINRFQRLYISRNYNKRTVSGSATTKYTNEKRVLLGTRTRCLVDLRVSELQNCIASATFTLEISFIVRGRNRIVSGIGVASTHSPLLKTWRPPTSSWNLLLLSVRAGEVQKSKGSEITVCPCSHICFQEWEVSCRRRVLCKPENVFLGSMVFRKIIWR